MLFLARTVLKSTYREALERFNRDPAEIALWQAEYDLSPWGEFRSDIQSAYVCATTASAAGAKDVKLTDFIHRFDAEQEPQTVEQMQAVLLRGNHGGRSKP